MRITDSAVQFAKKNYWLLRRLRFYNKVRVQLVRADKLLQDTLEAGACYYGPFKGEFGHLLAHNLPFLVYLHSKNIKIHYCGLALTKPFLIDERGEPIIHESKWLRDIFGETWANTNSTVLPADVEAEVDTWKAEAKESGLPYWPVDEDFFYWFAFREWMTEGYMKTYDLSQYYGPKENSVSIFARSKDAASSPTNGDPWDYVALAHSLSGSFDKVYLVGHPAMSSEFDFAQDGNIEVCITADNEEILKRCSRSRLIVTQHSGAVYLGEYTNCPVLIIYKGEGAIETYDLTEKFKQKVGERHPLTVARTTDEITSFIETNFSQ
jgi:hypothetical protein